MGFFLLTRAVALDVPFIWCLVFGALISPTDPVAVMSVLKRAHVGSALQATVAGESLFNDGVGVVVFSILLATALSGDAFSVTHALELFFIEAGGGILLGIATGWVAFRAMHSIDEYNIEVLISLAVVMGGYALARQLHVSGLSGYGPDRPIAEGDAEASKQRNRRIDLRFLMMAPGTQTISADILRKPL